MRAKDMLRPAAAASALAPFHFPVLVADIGGTNARFALLPDTESHMRVFADIATASYSSIEAAIEDAILPHADVRPHAAIVAGAGPVADEVENAAPVRLREDVECADRHATEHNSTII